MADAHAIVAKAFADGRPRIGFGTGDLFLDGRSGDAVRLLEAAYDAGFRYFDTARLYGDGQAEQVLGQALSKHRDQIVIASKAGIIPWSMQTTRRVARKLLRGLAGPAAARENAFSERDIVASVEASLSALRTDHLDILLLHECTLADATSEQTLRAVDRLLQEGKIRAHGIATRHDRTMEILRAGATPAIVQAPADAIGQQVHDYGTADGRLLITHSALRPVMEALRTDASLAGRLQAATGVEASDTDQLVRLLTASALAANPDGVTLVSTLKPERVASLYAAASKADAAPLAALEAALGRKRAQHEGLPPAT